SSSRLLEHVAVTGGQTGRPELAHCFGRGQRGGLVPGGQCREWEQWAQDARDGDAPSRLEGVARNESAVAQVEEADLAGRVPRRSPAPQRPASIARPEQPARLQINLDEVALDGILRLIGVEALVSTQESGVTLANRDLDRGETSQDTRHATDVVTVRVGQRD